MALSDVLPDRPLTFDEFQSIQRQDAFDEVYTLDKPGRIDTLILKQDGEETTIHYTEESGWHKHEDHAHEHGHQHDHDHDHSHEHSKETKERPGDFGTWRCEACGEEMLGERAEPPLDHVHSCEDATGQSLVFEADG